MPRAGPLCGRSLFGWTVGTRCFCKDTSRYVHGGDYNRGGTDLNPKLTLMERIDGKLGKMCFASRFEQDIQFGLRLCFGVEGHKAFSTGRFVKPLIGDDEHQRISCSQQPTAELYRACQD